MSANRLLERTARFKVVHRKTTGATGKKSSNRRRAKESPSAEMKHCNASNGLTDGNLSPMHWWATDFSSPARAYFT